MFFKFLSLTLWCFIWRSASQEVIDYGDYVEPPPTPAIEWIRRDETKYEYHFSPEKKTYDKAQSMCLEEEADLVSVLDNDENLWVHSKRSQRESQWIGLRNKRAIGIDNNNWRWEDWSDKSWTNWKPGEPATIGDACAGYTDVSKESRWFSFRCTAPRQFICKRKRTPCAPNPCPDHQECIIKGDDYECKCEDCPSDFNLVLSKWSKNKFLFGLLIAVFIIVVLVVIIIAGSCIRGCLESSRGLPKRSRKDKKKDKASYLEEDNDACESVLCETNKPPLPPNKPKWTRDQSKTSPSLSGDSARGRSQSSDEDDVSDGECRKIDIELHSQNQYTPAPDNRPAYARPLSME